jgi:signal transduction histidine kinase/ActR/RegA family two-component response regulator
MGDISPGRAEAALRQELEACQARLRNLIERNADGTLVVSPDGFIRFANPAACALLERPCEALLGQPFGIPVLPGGTTEIEIPLSGRGVRFAELRVVETEWEGQPACLVALRDISEHRRLQEALQEKAAQLEEANRRKDEFLALLSHELRNPLAAIVNSVNVLSLVPVEQPTVSRQVAVIERQTRHLTRLVDDLLDVLRVTQGKITLRMEPVELCEQVIEPGIELAQPQINAFEHELEVTLPGRPLYVHGDAERLQQVVANLLNNAAKYTPAGGRIRLSVTAEDDRVCIRVRDNGVGIASELLPHIFDLFIQADESLDRAQGGLGVGLTLVRGLIRLHGGTITAVSAGPGAGSEFTVLLPALASEIAGPAQRGGGPGGDEAAARQKVLVVDDNLDAAETLAELLRCWGHEAQIAPDGPTALRLVPELRPDVLLLDLGLPEIDGFAVAEELARAGLRDDLLLVATTGYGMEADRARTRSAGFDHHLVKPIDPEVLRRLLAEEHRPARASAA